MYHDSSFVSHIKLYSTSHLQTKFTVVGGEGFFFALKIWFSLNIFRSKCRMVLIFLLAQRARSGQSSEYLECDCRMRRKFSRDLWKKFSPEKWGFCQNIPASFWGSFSFKKRKFWLFLAYNMIGVLYGSDFFTRLKS